MKRLLFVLSIVIWFTATVAVSVELKTGRVVGSWEIPSSGYDCESFSFKADGTYVHRCQDGSKVTADSGKWRVSGKTLLLTEKGVTAKVGFRAGRIPDEDALDFSRDTVANRAHYVAERRLMSRLSQEPINVSLGGGKAYEINFQDGKTPRFIVYLWPMTLEDINTLKKLVRDKFQALGTKPIHPITYTIKGM